MKSLAENLLMWSRLTFDPSTNACNLVIEVWDVKPRYMKLIAGNLLWSDLTSFPSLMVKPCMNYVTGNTDVPSLRLINCGTLVYCEARVYGRKSGSTGSATSTIGRILSKFGMCTQ